MGADDEAAGGDDAIERAAIDDEVRITGNACARHGSIEISSPSLKMRMCSWQVVVRVAAGRAGGR